jgi:hypothetical protein
VPAITIQTDGTARALSSGGGRPAGSGFGDLGGQSLKGSRDTRPNVLCPINAITRPGHAQSGSCDYPKVRLTLAPLESSEDFIGL